MANELKMITQIDILIVKEQKSRNLSRLWC